MTIFRLGSLWDIPPRVVHRGLISNPDTAQSAGTSELIVQIRYDASSGIVRLTIESSHNPGVVDLGFSILLKSRNALTVTAGYSPVVAGETVAIQGSGTNEVEVISQLSSVAGPWEIDNESARVDLTITGNEDGARCLVALWGGSIGSGLDQIADTIWWGQSELDSQVSIDGNPVIYEVWLSPQLVAGQIADGAVGTAQLADLAVTTAKLGASSVTDAKVSSIGAAKINESATRKWAAETGADVTGSNQAASIAGQGDLATLDTVGASEIDTGAVVEAKIGTGAVTNAKLGASSITQDKLDDDSVGIDELDSDSIYGAAFTSAVQLAMADYNTAEGPDTESEWDAV